MEALQSWGIQLIQSLQLLSPALDPFMDIFTFMGRIEFYMLFITFLYWIVDARLGFRAFMVLLSTDIVGVSLKLLLHQPRPYWLGEVRQMSVEPSYGIPSTHASDSISLWPYLAYQVKKRWLWITVIALVPLISFSRLYLGVHFPHDILGGWLVGLAVLFLFIKFGDAVSNWLAQKSLRSQVGFGFIFSLLFILAGVLAKTIVASTPDPQSWSFFSTEARSLTHFFTLAGAFFGAFTGYALLKSKAYFQTKGSFGQKLGRYLVGMLGVLIAIYGLDVLFGLIAADESLLGYLLRYIRYGTTTFWAMFGAPWVFLKIKLAKK
jgi:membrane-associated phospholipid phosphatase